MRPLDVPHRTAHLDLPDGRLQVLTAGDTGPPVLLLSGGGIDHAVLSWRRLIPQLAVDHRVIAPDWPKQGGSREWTGLADHAALLGVVDAVVERLGLDVIDLVGLSQGGAVTLAYALERPDGVRRIVAMAPAGTISFPPVLHQLLWLTARWSGPAAALTSLAFRSRARVERFVRAALIPGPVDDLDQIVDEVFEEARLGSSASDWQNTSIGPWRMAVDLRPRLGEIRCPALLIQGSRDVGVKPSATAAAARAIPGAHFELIEGAGHWVNRQEPERVGRLVTEFLTP